MELPAYYLVGQRPVKFIETKDGGLDILALNWDTGNFEREMEYYLRINENDFDVKEVTAKEFNRAVEKIRADINKK